MPSIKKVSARKFRVFVFNGYMPNGKKICKTYTVDVPISIHNIDAYVAASAYKLEVDFRRGTHINDKTTLSEYVENWITRQTKYKASTFEGHKRMLKYICNDIGGIKLSNLRPIIIEEEIRVLRARKHAGKRIKDTTVKSYINALSAVLEDAVRNRFLLENPIRLIEWPVSDRTEQHIPTEIEMTRFVATLDEEALIYKAYYLLALYSGARRGELCALRWGDINAGLMTISKSRVYIPSQGVIESSTKNRHSRIVPITNKVQKHLDELKLRQLQGHSWCCIQNKTVRKLKCRDTDYIFVNDEGIVVSPSRFTGHIRKIAIRIDLPEDFHLHTLRHYYASYLLNYGVSSKMVADLLGHRDTGFLERTYGHAMPEISEKVIRALDQMDAPVVMETGQHL